MSKILKNDTIKEGTKRIIQSPRKVPAKQNKKKPDSGTGYFVALPPVFNLLSKYSIERLEEERTKATSNTHRLVCSWRIVALTGLQRAEDVLKKVKEAGCGPSNQNYADFIRATSIASVMASCADELEQSL